MAPIETVTHRAETKHDEKDSECTGDNEQNKTGETCRHARKSPAVSKHEPSKNSSECTKTTELGVRARIPDESRDNIGNVVGNGRGKGPAATK